jgi:hypothetical protein
VLDLEVSRCNVLRIQIGDHSAQLERAPLVGGETVAGSAQGGLAPSPALWPVHLRILFVLDARIDTSHGAQCFGLGYVLDTLRDPSFAWWVRMRVDVVRRDKGDARLEGCPAGDLNYLGLGDDVDFDTSNFRFTDPKFRLENYHQVWFFGDFPANSSGPIDFPIFCPLSDDELRLLAEWMDNGGGVFATGDHFNLGASMCSRIPRVRTMRRWTQAQGVPPQDGPYRHETLQHVPGGFAKWEGDTTPQTIEPVLQARSRAIFGHRWVAHPLLCGPDGIIETFPDHMHEGDVIEDDQVELDLSLDIPGYDRPEYPYARPEFVAALASGVELPRVRPRPHVVAHGLTTNLVPPFPPTPPPAEALFGGVRERFGLIGAYDGDAAGLGRVVVDSTWHHWFSYNLHDFASAQPPTVFRRMQAYYRNVALWLATPAQRQAMLVAATWGPVVSDPMAFPPHPGRSVWAIGARVIDMISPTLSDCTLYDFVASLFGGSAEAVFAVPADSDPYGPCPDSLPPELAVRAIVGGLGSALIGPAQEYYKARADGRRLLDPAQISHHALQGLERGHAALVEAVRSSAVANEKLAARLVDTFRRPDVAPQIEHVPLRVLAERLQLPDLTDPALLDRDVTFTARVSLSGLVVASNVVEIEVPSATAADAVVELDSVLYDGVAQSGESLLLELVLGTDARDPIPPERLRFSETLSGLPSTWIGPHVPAQAQLWRLWFRVEQRS